MGDAFWILLTMPTQSMHTSCTDPPQASALCRLSTKNTDIHSFPSVSLLCAPCAPIAIGNIGIAIGIEDIGHAIDHAWPPACTCNMTMQPLSTKHAKNQQIKLYFVSWWSWRLDASLTSFRFISHFQFSNPWLEAQTFERVKTCGTRGYGIGLRHKPSQRVPQHPNTKTIKNPGKARNFKKLPGHFQVECQNMSELCTCFKSFSARQTHLGISPNIDQTHPSF